MSKSRRRRQVVKDTIYVVCGNTKTEKNYFDHLRKRFNNHLGKMKITTVKLGDNSSSPASLIKDAKKVIKSDPSIQSCWIICDKDSFDLNAVIEEAKYYNKTNDTKINVIWSNISFEVWFLYHFQYTTKEMTVKDLEKLLSQIISDRLNGLKKYSKTDIKLFELLREFEHKAILHSKKSYQTHNRNGKSANESCSSTKMFKFFEFIDYFLEDYSA